MAEVRALQDVGQFDASIEELQEILAIDPDLPEANYRLGLAQVQMGEPSRAIWALQKAMESSEYADSAPACCWPPRTSRRSNFDEAIRAATRVLEADPEREAALRIRATALLGARRLEEALKDTTRLVELLPDDYVVRALHATVLADLGRLEEAEREHEMVKKIGLQSDDPDMRMRACLAVAVFAKDVKKDVAKARVAYDECAEQHPTDPTLLDNVVRFFDSVNEPARGTRDRARFRRGGAREPRAAPHARESAAHARRRRGRREDAARDGRDLRLGAGLRRARRVLPRAEAAREGARGAAEGRRSSRAAAATCCASPTPTC